MRVLLIHERYRQAGGEDAVFAAESALLEAAGCQVSRLVADNHTIAAGQSGLALALGAIWSRQGRQQVVRAIREHRPDVVHVHNWFPLLSPAIHSAIRAQGVPVVQTLHNFRLLCLNGLFFRAGSPCEDCLTRKLKWPGVARRCYRDDRRASAAVAAMNLVHWTLGTWSTQVNHFLTYSEFSRDRFITAGLPAERISVTHNTAADPGPAAASWDHPRRGALFIGRLAEGKGATTLIRAWHNMDEPLIVVGDGPLAADLRAQAGENVTFLGACPPAQVSLLLSATRLLCVPSDCYEQQPLVVAEAAAHGVPVLASAHGGLGASIEPGRNGHHATAGDVASWQREAAALLARPDYLSQLGHQARALYQSRHAPATVVAARLALYSRLVDTVP